MCNINYNQNIQHNSNENLSPLITQKPIKRKITLCTPRACVNHTDCIFGCKLKKLRVIQNDLRKKVFEDYRFFISEGSLICEHHLEADEWRHLIRKKPRFDYDYKQVESVFDLLLFKEKARKKAESRTFNELFDKIGLTSESVKIFCGLNKTQIEQLHSKLSNSRIKVTRIGLVAYLIKLKTGHTNDQIANMTNTARRNLQHLMMNARIALEKVFVPQYLGFNHIEHNTIVQHTTDMSRSLYCNHPNNAVVIWDATYIFIQKSACHTFQRRSYSGQKNRHLLKPMLAVATDGYILDVYGLFPGNVNDAQILNFIYDKNKDVWKNTLEDGDVFLFDRGFRDVVRKFRNLKFSVFIPRSSTKNEPQLNWRHANESRIVTKVRQVIERVNNRLKSFKLLDKVFVNRSLKHLNSDIRIVSAIINCFFKPLKTDEKDSEEIAELMKKNKDKENELVFLKNIRNSNKVFHSIDQSDIEFPTFSLEQLRLISLGNYQIKMAKSYYGEHIRPDGLFKIELCEDVNDLKLISKIIEKKKLKKPVLLHGHIKSRHMGSVKYNVYVLADTELKDISAIIAYYCTCKNGTRTIGTCSHVMCLIWYLSYGRHNHTDPPAQSQLEILLDCPQKL